MTATATKTRKPQTRKAHVSQIGGSVILWLTVDKNVTAYRVRPLESQMGGIAFRLEKADKGHGETEVYDVLLDGQQSRCCCRGFEKHGMCKDGKGCKHIAGCQAAVAAGQLQAAPKPEAKPAMQPAPRQPWCSHCNDNPDVFCEHCSL
jgi:hypothetical protein